MQRFFSIWNQLATTWKGYSDGFFSSMQIVNMEQGYHGLSTTTTTILPLRVKVRLKLKRV